MSEYTSTLHSGLVIFWKRKYNSDIIVPVEMRKYFCKKGFDVEDRISLV